jgi:hypothetical protein
MTLSYRPPPFSFDETRWPLLVVTIRGRGSDAEFAAFLSHFSRLLQRGQACAFVLDARLAENPSAHQLHMQGRWLAHHREAIQALGRGGAFVFSSPLLRLAFSALLRIQPMPVPHMVSASMDEALAWATQRLANS